VRPAYGSVINESCLKIRRPPGSLASRCDAIRLCVPCVAAGRDDKIYRCRCDQFRLAIITRTIASLDNLPKIPRPPPVLPLPRIRVVIDVPDVASSDDTSRRRIRPACTYVSYRNARANLYFIAPEDALLLASRDAMNNAALDIALIFGSRRRMSSRRQRRDRKVFRRDLRSGLDYREIRLSDRGSNRREERHHESNVIDNQTFDVLSTSLPLSPRASASLSRSIVDVRYYVPFFEMSSGLMDNCGIIELRFPPVGRRI